MRRRRLRTDPDARRRDYESVPEIILSIDGLQPEKGHEALYVVRELTRKRIWFAGPLISATAGEVRRLIARAKQWAEALHKPVALWVSDKQDAFVTGIAAEFPDVPHRYCENHFLRDLAKPVLEADSHAKVRTRRKVRGRRRIEQAVLKHQGGRAMGALVPDDPEATVAVIASAAHAPGPAREGAEGVVLDYCTAVRGILNDDQGGPLRPPGLRMAEALQEVRASIRRDLDEAKGGPKGNSRAWPSASRAAWATSGKSGRRSGNTSGDRRGGGDPRARDRGEQRSPGAIREADRCEATEGPIRHRMATVMAGFVAGLFVGEDEWEEIRDNLDLERWFRLPKGHERRIHGRRRAGVRLVIEGATLVHAPDAHAAHPGPYTGRICCRIGRPGSRHARRRR